MKNQIFPATSMPDADWWQALWPDPLTVLKTLGFRPDMSAVDLCCGDGHFTAPMAAILNGKLYAVDIDPEMLTLAKLRAKEGVRWIESDARHMPEVIPELVDIVFIANTFHGVPEQAAMAKCAYQVLKPGGTFIVVNWHVAPPANTPVLGQPRGPKEALRMTPGEVAQQVEPAGFNPMRVEELPPYHYGAIFQKPEKRAKSTERT